jgi:hypothetical protein
MDRLAAGQFPGPRRGADDDAEPSAADVPAVDADVDTGGLIAAQLPQVLVMHDASDGGQVGSCSCEPPRGNQYLSRIRTLITTARTQMALDDHPAGEAVVAVLGGPGTSDPSAGTTATTVAYRGGHRRPAPTSGRPVQLPDRGRSAMMLTAMQLTFRTRIPARFSGLAVR